MESFYFFWRINLIVNVVATTLGRYLQLGRSIDFQIVQKPFQLFFLNWVFIFKFVLHNKCDDLLLWTWHDFDFNFVTLSVFRLNMLGSTNTFEVSVHHDTQLGRKSFGLFHRMCSQDDSRLFLLRSYSWNNLPHESTGFWIHTCRRLIQKDNVWIADHGHGNWQFSLVTSRKSPW